MYALDLANEGTTTMYVTRVRKGTVELMGEQEDSCGPVEVLGLKPQILSGR